jgi:hypothetical protein
MSRCSATGVLSFLLCACASCGGRAVEGADGPPGRDFRPWPDRASPPRPERGVRPPDRAVPPKLDRGPFKPDLGPCQSTIGARCTASSPCCGNLTCLKLDTGASVCSIACTPDDQATPLVNEDSCPQLSTHVCGKDVHHCLRRCVPTTAVATCPSGLACHPRSVRFAQELDIAVCAYPACTGPKDCPVFLATPCSPSAPAMCPGSASGNFCAAEESGSYRCAMPGACDAKSGLCLPHALSKNVDVGGACTEDATCVSQGICDIERFSAAGVLHARNGYCTIEGCAFAKTLLEAACPYGSTCHRLYLGGRCMRKCDPSKAGDCRGSPADKYGDYECYAWNNLVLGSTPVSDQPTCEPADNYPCSLFAPSKLDCTVLAPQTANPQQMKCRDRGTGAVLPNNSPAGVCLDLTASGP